MTEQDIVGTIENAMIYATNSCGKTSCGLCPAAEYAKTPGNTCNCELYFVKEYFEKHNLHIMKEDC